jgi:hypothetical protein
MSVGQEYWALEWLRESHITSLEEAHNLLPKYKVLDTLRQRAEDFVTTPKEPTLDGASILAGTGIDLWGGRMVCPGPTCMRKQVDTLLKHVWHYFDRVVVDDALTTLLTDDWGGSKKDLIRSILHQLAPLLYLVEIGASEYVEFRPKDRCASHWEEHAREQGMGGLLESKEQLVATLMAGAKFSKDVRKDGRSEYHMYCGDAGVRVTAALNTSDDEQAHLFLARQVFAEYMVDLTADVSAARDYGLPLGSVLAFPGRILQMSRPPSVEDVVFQLQLPVLEGIPARDLIAIRLKESEYFENFRDALRRAARERIGLGPDISATLIADEIRTDLVEPELARIKARLAASESTLAKKVGVGLFLGTVATTCGVLYGLTPEMAISAGTGTAITATAVAGLKHLDSKEEVSLNDMYFLWRAAEHAH